MRQVLTDVYLEWVNNYLSIEKFAEDYGLHVNEAQELLALGKKIMDNKHPEE